ncbi:uncharacterized protein HD556DRAFT_1305432 [Suillus plorans]|uniref:Uncharacterized protein n=1 Tax=Suillus plorans TaxID=116603 RepID=A0A9P7J2E0_9AGAM|nr:uncharacterized protein HD556DRAFT_1305432 [Suillus plorans]KAG1799927.1 hypothetical protein HD556DRAFT_1305432 [Suillus plorans]
MTSRTPTRTIQNQPSIEEPTAQRAKALEEDRKDVLRELERCEREPVTFNAGERVADLVRFWKEWELDYSPAWRFVGQHMRWTASMEKIADWHTRRAMNVQVTGPTPPMSQSFGQSLLYRSNFWQYISIHMRHGDFSQVSEAQEELRTRKGIDATHVIMTSDERDPEWWSDVRALGWTMQRSGQRRSMENEFVAVPRHPVFIDVIIQLNGAGFVGTRGSTSSRLASREVRS